MDIDVTHMVEDADEMPLLSGSRAELGDNAGRITWNNSVQYASNKPLLSTEEEKAEAREYFLEFGAWDEEEIAAWTEDELQGIMVQDVAANIREMKHYRTYRQYQKAAEDGQCSGNLYKSGIRWYFYVGH